MEFGSNDLCMRKMTKYSDTIKIFMDFIDFLFHFVQVFCLSIYTDFRIQTIDLIDST